MGETVTRDREAMHPERAGLGASPDDDLPSFVDCSERQGEPKLVVCRAPVGMAQRIELA